MGKIEKGKKQLSGLSIATLVIAAFILAVGLLGLIRGAQSGNVTLLVLGIVGLLLSLLIAGYAIYTLIISSRLIATKGNIAEGNEGVGTVNMQKCQKCGMPLDPQTQECPNHGKDTNNK